MEKITVVLKDGVVITFEGKILESIQHQKDCKHFFKLGYNQCNPSEIDIKEDNLILNIFNSSYNKYVYPNINN